MTQKFHCHTFFEPQFRVHVYNFVVWVTWVMSWLRTTELNQRQKWWSTTAAIHYQFSIVSVCVTDHKAYGKKVKQLLYRPGQALGVPGWGSQIPGQLEHEGG